MDTRLVSSIMLAPAIAALLLSVGIVAANSLADAPAQPLSRSDCVRSVAAALKSEPRALITDEIKELVLRAQKLYNVDEKHEEFKSSSLCGPFDDAAERALESNNKCLFKDTTDGSILRELARIDEETLETMETYVICEHGDATPWILRERNLYDIIAHPDRLAKLAKRREAAAQS